MSGHVQLTTIGLKACEMLGQGVALLSAEPWHHTPVKRGALVRAVGKGLKVESVERYKI